MTEGIAGLGIFAVIFAAVASLVGVFWLIKSLMPDRKARKEREAKKNDQVQDDNS